jgi:Fic family protein
MFEHIHPVTDGNGRIGRLLVPLMLRSKCATRAACACFGEAVHEDKDLYVEALKAARRTGTWARGRASCCPSSNARPRRTLPA